MEDKSSYHNVILTTTTSSSHGAINVAPKDSASAPNDLNSAIKSQKDHLTASDIERLRQIVSRADRQNKLEAETRAANLPLRRVIDPRQQQLAQPIPAQPDLNGFPIPTAANPIPPAPPPFAPQPTGLQNLPEFSVLPRYEEATYNFATDPHPWIRRPYTWDLAFPGFSTLPTGGASEDDIDLIQQYIYDRSPHIDRTARDVLKERVSPLEPESFLDKGIRRRNCRTGNCVKYADRHSHLQHFLRARTRLQEYLRDSLPQFRSHRFGGLRRFFATARVTVPDPASFYGDLLPDLGEQYLFDPESFNPEAFYAARFDYDDGPYARRVRAARPVPLTAGQEAEVREVYYANVRAKCADQIRDFAQCATGRTLSITWVCREQRKAMESCMVGYATRDEEDRAREEWFAKVGERRRKKEEEERWKEGQRQKKREWWAEYERERGRGG
ncbi:MAG: hypothetical protein Q9162_004536 [Coniocarpon cinnabarinum]